MRARPAWPDARPSCCFLRIIQNNQRLTGFISLRIYLKSIRGLCPKYLIQGSLLGARFASSARSDTVFEDVRGGAHRPRPARAVARTPRGLPRIASRRRMADYTWRLAPPVCDKRAKVLPVIQTRAIDRPYSIETPATYYASVTCCGQAERVAACGLQQYSFQTSLTRLSGCLRGNRLSPRPPPSK
jgi:hypothetical protein